MISMPDRTSEAIRAIELGEPVDWKRLADLTTLDMVLFGKQCVEDAILENEKYDAEFLRMGLKLLES